MRSGFTSTFAYWVNFHIHLARPNTKWYWYGRTSAASPSSVYMLTSNILLGESPWHQQAKTSTAFVHMSLWNELPAFQFSTRWCGFKREAHSELTYRSILRGMQMKGILLLKGMQILISVRVTPISEDPGHACIPTAMKSWIGKK